MHFVLWPVWVCIFCLYIHRDRASRIDWKCAEANSELAISTQPPPAIRGKRNKQKNLGHTLFYTIYTYTHINPLRPLVRTRPPCRVRVYVYVHKRSRALSRVWLVCCMCVCVRANGCCALYAFFISARAFSSTHSIWKNDAMLYTTIYIYTRGPHQQTRSILREDQTPHAYMFTFSVTTTRKAAMTGPGPSKRTVARSAVRSSDWPPCSGVYSRSRA